MNEKKLWLPLVLVGMTLGTAWAIRGQFGHEQGAAWAGAIGALSIVLLSGRSDWNSKLFKATMAAAIGWGLGGMMSYGRVVGFGRGVDFVNVYYGLVMLFVIGGLYGFLGGALFGLALTDDRKKRIDWAVLFAGMVAAGGAAYFFLVMQWEWLMTPPRSEVWSVCLGMALFLIWFLVKHNYKAAIRVAIFSGLGGGFGFAFGNFLQVLGNVSEVPFNFWNVMEYSLGFFGGVGMAYGTFTAAWVPEDPLQRQSKISNLLPLLFVVLFIPLVVWQQSFEVERLERTYGNLVSGGAGVYAQWVALAVLLLIILHAGYVWIRYHRQKESLISYGRSEVRSIFRSHFLLYILLSWLITGALISTYRIEQYLYVANFIAIWILWPKDAPPFFARSINTKKWARNFLFVLVIIAVLAFVAIHTHGEMPGMQRRFEF